MAAQRDDMFGRAVSCAAAYAAVAVAISWHCAPQRAPVTQPAGKAVLGRQKKAGQFLRTPFLREGDVSKNKYVSRNVWVRLFHVCETNNAHKSTLMTINENLFSRLLSFLTLFKKLPSS